MSERAKMLYEMRLSGLTNIQIGIKLGIKPHSVGSQVCQYRKKHKLPPLPKPPPSKTKQRFMKVFEQEEEIRKENHKQAHRREDGVLQCPTKHLEGFGFDKKLEI